ncbi:MAG: Histidinol-phosphate aminotransferase [Candidatus Ozemobacter sibiricus]|jgi:histidinol-phosphate aminotransferase|uniref:Aminotransferase n=1 Tax=Candidatus Ozemobacter sibiricus TaxID=2268124 RepID=A0A367ZLX1_9BACT|nr:MAG: Histidinol-phosphate aminotransferase [Candidatus Ozemobacter sibiricus]
MSLKPVPHIEALEEYAVTSQDVWRIEDPHHASRVLKLDWNESPAVLDIVRQRLAEFLAHPGSINWYPDVAALELSKAIADHLGLSHLQVLPFGGSDVALETVARTYLGPGDPVVLVHPGYDNFRLYAEACGARIHRVVPGPDPLAFSMSAFIDAIRALGPARLIYLIQPNNPVGYLASRAELIALLQAFPETAIIVDEAYIEFAEGEPTAAPLITQFDHLFVARSFSKAFGLAGLRLGYVVSHHRNLAHLRKLRNGKNLTMFAQIAGTTLLQNIDLVRQHVARVKAGRRWFTDAYRARGGTILDSQGNFALVRVADPQEVIFRLKMEGIYVRDRSSMRGLEGMLRLTFGPPEIMARVLAAFEAMPDGLWQTAR